MQARKAAQRRRKWGDRPCDHPEIDKEYYLGAQTGDHLCTRCGRVVDPDEAKMPKSPSGADKRVSGGPAGYRQLKETAETGVDPRPPFPT